MALFSSTTMIKSSPLANSIIPLSSRGHGIVTLYSLKPRRSASCSSIPSSSRASIVSMYDLPTETTPILASPPFQIVRSNLFTREKARTASILCRCILSSCAFGVSGKRMFKPSSGILKPSGSNIFRRFISTFIEAVDSTVSCKHFKPTQQPLYLERAQP